MPNNILIFPLGAAGPPGPPGSDIYAATRVVSLIPGEGTDLTIAAALAALPVEGGLIFVKQGTYAIAASLVIPDKPVAIRGAGDGTIIDIGGNAITAFTTAFDKDLSFESFRVTGNGSAGQGFFDYTGVAARTSQLTFRSILVGNYNGASNSVETIIRSTVAVLNNVRVSDSFFVVPLSVAGRFISVAATGGDFRVERVHVFGSGGISGSPQLFAENCEFSIGANGMVLVGNSGIVNCAFTGASTVQGISQCRISGCIFEGGTKLRFTGSRNLVMNSVFSSVIATHIETIGSNLTVIGCSFTNFTSEAVLIIGASECVIIGNQGCKVTESGVGTNDNLYSNNTGFDGSNISASRSIVTDWNVRSVAVNTTLNETHRTVEVDASGAARTITLPTAAAAIYRKYTIKKTDASANTVTIDADAGELIDGALTAVIGVQYGSLTVQSNGTSWSIVVSDASGPFGIFAASRIVSLVPGEGTDLTIAAALAALPAEGGDIYVKYGTYPIAASLDFGSKNIRLRGAGTSRDFTLGATTLVPAAGISLFKNGRACSIEDMVFLGDNATSQILYEDALGGGSEIRFARINTHDIGGIVRGSDAFNMPEVEFTDSYIEIPSGPGIPLADRYVWKGNQANGELVFNYVELFVTGAGATLMSGVTAGANGPTFRVVDSYVGGGGGGGSTNFWFAQTIEWTQFEIDNAQFEISGAFNTIVNCGFLDFSIKFLAVWNFISNSKFSQGGTGAPFFPSQVEFAGGFAGVDTESIVDGCLFYGNSASLTGVTVRNVSPVIISDCIFTNHPSQGILLTAGTVPKASKVVVTGCSFTESVPVAESDANCEGVYDANKNFGGSVILGTLSIVDKVNVRNLAVSLTLDYNHRTALMDATGLARVVTLPTAASAIYRQYTIKKIDASVNTVTVDAAGAETIDGALTVVLTLQWERVTIQSNGTAWFRVD
jgi:hypothetical protein